MNEVERRRASWRRFTAHVQAAAEAARADGERAVAEVDGLAHDDPDFDAKADELVARAVEAFNRHRVLLDRMLPEVQLRERVVFASPRPLPIPPRRN